METFHFHILFIQSKLCCWSGWPWRWRFWSWRSPTLPFMIGGGGAVQTFHFVSWYYYFSKINVHNAPAPPPTPAQQQHKSLLYSISKYSYHISLEFMRYDSLGLSLSYPLPSIQFIPSLHRTMHPHPLLPFSLLYCIVLYYKYFCGEKESRTKEY